MSAATLLSAWGLDAAIARDQMYRAATARERERWHQTSPHDGGSPELLVKRAPT
jgi:hypothetical protein